jgi:hypothetical protein
LCFYPMARGRGWPPINPAMLIEHFHRLGVQRRRRAPP